MERTEQKKTKNGEIATREVCDVGFGCELKEMEGTRGKRKKREERVQCKYICVSVSECIGKGTMKYEGIVMRE